jgi:2-methylcitrate dehydratase PrpD
MGRHLRLSLARQIVTSTRSITFEQLPAEVVEKVKICFMDFLSAACESLDLPWSGQALGIAGRGQGSAAIIGSRTRVPAGDAAFVNGILGHGLVREDMHTGSVSHLGVVIFPTLMALASDTAASGRDFITAAVCGYEVGAQIGRALMTPENVRQYRPTGICGPPGAALAGARILDLDEDASVSAVAFGANVAAGLNEWPQSGGDEMFFQVGFAARNAVLSAQLAQAGARCSETSLDGVAGLFRALHSQDRAGKVKPFDSGYEILAVFHKAAPACNYAQTAAQAAFALSDELRQRGLDTSAIESIRVRSTSAAIAYPGCNHPGPFLKTLQAKMSIHYCVAATLYRGEIAEANYRLLDHPEINRLAGLTTLELDSELTASYPGLQGSEVILTLRDGSTLNRRLPDLIPATPPEIRSRFLRAAEPVFGREQAQMLEAAIDRLEFEPAAATLAELASLSRTFAAHRI